MWFDLIRFKNRLGFWDVIVRGGSVWEERRGYPLLKVHAKEERESGFCGVVVEEGSGERKREREREREICEMWLSMCLFIGKNILTYHSK